MKTMMNWNGDEWDNYLRELKAKRLSGQEMSTGKQIAYLVKLSIPAEVALDLTKREAAELIQTRLNEIGVYKNNRATEIQHQLIAYSKVRSVA